MERFIVQVYVSAYIKADATNVYICVIANNCVSN